MAVSASLGCWKVIFIHDFSPYVFLTVRLLCVWSSLVISGVVLVLRAGGSEWMNTVHLEVNSGVGSKSKPRLLREVSV